MKKLKQLARLISINCLVLLLLLLVVEIVLRIAGLGYGEGPVDADPVLNFVRPTNYLFKKYSTTGEFGHFTVYFDSLGRRAPLPGKAVPPGTGTKPVVFMGDSFVETLEVPDDSSFIGHLAARFPNYSFLNYGMGRYSPVLHYLRCKKMLYEHKVTPAMVIMVVTSNDVREDSGYLSRAVYDSVGHEIIAIDGGKKNWFKSLLRQSYLVRMCRKVYIKWLYSKTFERAGATGAIVGGYLEESPLLDSSLSEQYILKTRAMLQERNIPFYLSAIPSKYINFTKDTSFVSFAQTAESWSLKHDIPFINLHHTFDSVSIQTGKKLFFDKDIHCNTKGNLLIADILTQQLDSLMQINPQMH